MAGKRYNDQGIAGGSQAATDFDKLAGPVRKIIEGVHVASEDYEDIPVTVATAPNAVIAATWKEMLCQEGIVATVKCDDPLAVAYLVTSPYPCEILVPASQAEQARIILESLFEEAPEGYI